MSEHEEREQELIGVNVKLTEFTHRAIKVRAALSGLTIATYTRLIVEHFVRENGHNIPTKIEVDHSSGMLVSRKAVIE